MARVFYFFLLAVGVAAFICGIVLPQLGFHWAYFFLLPVGILLALIALWRLERG